MNPLSEKRELVQALGTQLFEHLTKLPSNIRQDEKERAGICIVAREIETRNLIIVSIKDPSEAARFFAIEKSVRTECYNTLTSQDSECPEKMQFAGCISYSLNNNKSDLADVLHISVSGLKAEEDVAVAIIIMSRILVVRISDVINNIKEIAETFDENGLLPNELFDKNHYLYDLLKKFDELHGE